MIDVIEGWDTQGFRIKHEVDISVFVNDERKFLKIEKGCYRISKQEEENMEKQSTVHSLQSTVNRDDVFESLSDLELLSLAIYGEARGEKLDGMLAVGSVILNRVNNPTWWGRDLKSVILKPAQFSCFMQDDPNRDTLETIAVEFDESLDRLDMLRRCYWIAKGVIEDFLSSNVGNANHYHSRRVSPSWAEKMTFITQIGNHKFYEGR